MATLGSGNETSYAPSPMNSESGPWMLVVCVIGVPIFIIAMFFVLAHSEGPNKPLQQHQRSQIILPR